MKAIICLAAIVSIAVAYPAQEGAAYTNEAIRQAQSSHLIPQNAQIQKVWHFAHSAYINIDIVKLIWFTIDRPSKFLIIYYFGLCFLWLVYRFHCVFFRVFFLSLQKVEEGIELGALENIPGNQRVDLYSLLGSQFPIEVVQNLQRQIDSVGRY